MIVFTDFIPTHPPTSPSPPSNNEHTHLLLSLCHYGGVVALGDGLPPQLHIIAMQTDSNFQQYVQAQVERLTMGLQHVRTELTRLDQHQTAIAASQKKQEEIEMKIRLMEVYHAENFRNNERLFGAQHQVLTVERRVAVLEEKQADWQNQTYRGDSREDQNRAVIEEMKSLVKRMEEVEAELQRNRQKMQLVTKFKRDPPRIINSESTKDISTELTTDKQLRKIEKKLQEFITERVKIIEGKYLGAVGEGWERAIEKHDETKAERKEGKHSKEAKDGKEEYWPSQTKASLRTADKRENDEQGSHHFRNKIDTYYTQPTERDDTDHLKKAKKSDAATSNPKKKSKSKSKQKKSKPLSIKSPPKQAINLSSVNEYLRLRGKKE